MRLEEVNNYLKYVLERQSEKHLKYDIYSQFVDVVEEPKEREVMLDYINWYEERYNLIVK